MRLAAAGRGDDIKQSVFIMVYFSDVFNIDEGLLDDYGAFNISLLNDMPLFIDPFLLYASEKQEYQELHHGIIRYLSFLRQKASEGRLSPVKIKQWYVFPEVKENWLGYSEQGNSGSGLGSKFGIAMSSAIVRFFTDLGEEKISETSHLEKLGLFRSGVGKDNISDFTCNLIKGYLLDYTQTFARTYLSEDMCKSVSVDKAYFDYKFECWCPKVYYLPYFNGDYIILTPKDILTKDENWINFSDMKYRMLEIANSIPNDELRGKINEVYYNSLPDKPKADDYTKAAEGLVNKFPEVMDYYIKAKEKEKKSAQHNSEGIVTKAEWLFRKNVEHLIKQLLGESGFYQLEPIGSFDASRQRVMFLKDVIENKDGYKLFYHDGKPVSKEKDLQLLFRFTWFGTVFDVNAEVNNGRGPVDYKVSMGDADKTLVEFKLAKNTKLKQNLKNQVKIYEAANNTNQSLKVILYFTEKEKESVLSILEELKLQDDENIILIDACDNKPSASNVK